MLDFSIFIDPSASSTIPWGKGGSGFRGHWNPVAMEQRSESCRSPLLLSLIPRSEFGDNRASQSQNVNKSLKSELDTLMEAAALSESPKESADFSLISEGVL
ncbi:hypothetical protein DM860_018072 [Cuscuta australis]|uniref:Uncharacterized protein n=1 Tax=Cuscuta australis TaxID=267555 RepID=A0A328CXR2_9ASTE|nr:hypothetical protein DM860_018072 [Cuscuta australis]